jgi:hypothetical protein
MSIDNPQTVKDLEALCVRLGAKSGQAAIMAGQILKRARQLAAENKCPETESLEYLINVIVSGRKGETFPSPFPQTGSPTAED